MPQYNQYITEVLKRQPDNINALQPTAFRFIMSKSPETVYFCQSAQIPALNINSTEVLSAAATFNVPDPKMSFEDLTLSFLVNEDMGNWFELYNWMLEFANVDGFSNPTKTLGDPADYKVDGSLILLNSYSNPSIIVTFKDIFPTNLSSIEFSTSETDITPIVCNATFQYRSYSVELVN